MKKIFKYLLALIVTGFMCLVSFGTTTYAAEIDEDIDPNKPVFVNKTAAELNLPVTLNYDAKRLGYDSSLSTYEVNGFKFNFVDGEITSIEPASNASTIETIAFMYSIGSNSISQSLYNNFNYGVFTSVKNVVIETTINSSMSLSIATYIPTIENIFVCDDFSCVPLTWSTSSNLKNVIHCKKADNARDTTWGTNSNFRLSTYPEGVKFVTIDALKWSLGIDLVRYKSNPSNNNTRDLTTYVVPNDYLNSLFNETFDRYSYIEHGGVIWTYVRNNYAQYGYSISYIDPSVKKIVIDKSAFGNNNLLAANEDLEINLDQVYCYNNTSAVACGNLTVKDLYAPLESSFKFVSYKNCENVYFYKTDTVLNLVINSHGINLNDTVSTNFYLPSVTDTVTNNSSNTAIISKITKGYNKTFTPVIEIEVDGEKESSSIFSTKVADLKVALNTRLEATAQIRNQAALVDDAINALPSAMNLTLNDKVSVENVRREYNALSETGKTFVQNITKLTQLGAKLVELETEAEQTRLDEAKALAVDALIGKLPITITLENKEAIENCRKEYNALTQVQKSYVTKLEDLITSEAILAELIRVEQERIATVKQHASEVDELISKIPTRILIEYKATIEIAREAYEKLTSEEKTYVKKYNTLKRAEIEIKRLEISSKKTAEELLKIKEDASKVDALINKLPADIKLSDKKQVEEARRAYDALDEDTKVFVNGIDNLEEAEVTIKELKQAEIGDNKLKEALENFKDKLNESKTLKTVTIIVSIVFSLVLFYGVYVLIKKIIKWLK